MSTRTLRFSSRAGPAAHAAPMASASPTAIVPFTSPPPGLMIDSMSGDITGTIGSPADTGSPYSVTVTASDGTQSASQTFNWTVSHLFLVNPGDQRNATGDTVLLPLSAGDSDSDTLM